MGPVQNAFHRIKKLLSHGFAFEKKFMSHSRRSWKKFMSHGYMFLKINWNYWITMPCILCWLFCIYKKDHTNVILNLLNKMHNYKIILVAYWKTPKPPNPPSLPTYPHPPLFLYIYIFNCLVEHSCGFVYV